MKYYLLNKVSLIFSDKNQSFPPLCSQITFCPTAQQAPVVITGTTISSRTQHFVWYTVDTQ